VDSAKLLAEHPHIQFLFVGEGARKEIVKQKAHALGLRNVRFLDSVNKADVKRFYALADVCFVPLRNIPLFDTFIPSKMFEIMAMGKPIIASVRGESADILKKAQGAIVVEPEDSQAIAEAVLALSQDHARRQRMGQHGRQFVTEQYSRHALALKYLDVMRTALSTYGK
jgi:glycosyltransferase involved in cell wall biosynthesis